MENMTDETKDLFEQTVNQYFRYKYEQSLTYVINNSFLSVDTPEKYKKLTISTEPANIILLKPFINIEEIFINSSYDGDLSFIDDFKIKKLSIHVEKTWKELSSLKLENVEELSIRVSSDDTSMVLNAPKLKSLAIACSTLNSHPKNDSVHKIDLSHYEYLEEIEFHGETKFDYSTLGSTKKLKRLSIIRDKINNIRWIEECSMLRSLTISGCGLSDIESIQRLENLEYLDLSRNEIKTIRPLLYLSGLNTVILYGNKITDNETIIDRVKAKEIVLTEQDNEFQTLISKSVKESVYKACSKVESLSTKPIEEIPQFSRAREIEERKLKPVERIKREFQREFIADFYNIKPLKYGLHTGNIGEIKEKYVEKMLSVYPFLTVTKEMRDSIDKDKRKFCVEYVRNSLILVTCDNVFAITVSCKESDADLDDDWDKDKIHIEITDGNNHRRALTSIIEDEREKYIEDYDIEEYEFDIKIEHKYSSRFHATDIAIPVMYAMSLAIKDRFQANKVLIGTFGLGKNCECAPPDLYIEMAKYEGASTILLYGDEENEELGLYQSEIEKKYGLECEFYPYIGAFFEV